jgi:hypothetical protein
MFDLSPSMLEDGANLNLSDQLAKPGLLGES